LKEILSDETSDKLPELVREKGESIGDQYDALGTTESDSALPDPLYL